MELKGLKYGFKVTGGDELGQTNRICKVNLRKLSE